MQLNDSLELHGMNYHVKPGGVYTGPDLCKCVTGGESCPKRAVRTWQYHAHKKGVRVCDWHHGKLSGLL